MLAAKERSHERRGYVGNASGSNGATAEGFGLDTKKWMAWLGLVAVGCTWFDKQRVSPSGRRLSGVRSQEQYFRFTEGGKRMGRLEA